MHLDLLAQLAHLDFELRTWNLETLNFVRLLVARRTGGLDGPAGGRPVCRAFGPQVGGPEVGDLLLRIRANCGLT